MKVLLLAGEPSGDRWAAGVARALRGLRPDVELRGMGGRASARAGVDLVVDSTRLAVVGLTEVVSRLPELLAARRALRRCLQQWRPDVVVPVDYPDFNLRIAGDARRRGAKVAWFVSPQAWAWRPGRIPTFGRVVSRMLVLFPFEVELYERHGIPVEHVGHPLVDVHREPGSPVAARAELALPATGPVVALLPGSRSSEIRRTWPVFVAAARQLQRGSSDVAFVVPLAPGVRRRDLDELAPTDDLEIRFAPESLEAAVTASDVAAVASGTATLETALLGRPLVVGYRVSTATITLGRWLADRAFLARGLFALPNLVLGEEVVPELYQERFTADNLSEVLRSLLQDRERRDAIVAGLARLPAVLGGPGALDRVARAVLELGE